jgi:hypothetical protein
MKIPKIVKRRSNGKKKAIYLFIPYSGPQTLLAVICNVFDPWGANTYKISLLLAC